LNIGVSRNRFCDFLADPDSRSFSRFGAIIMQFAVFFAPLYTENDPFCQDRLGTNIGKTLKQKTRLCRRHHPAAAAARAGNAAGGGFALRKAGAEPRHREDSSDIGCDGRADGAAAEHHSQRQHHPEVQKPPFGATFQLKTGYFPRQARDKHRENSKHDLFFRSDCGVSLLRTTQGEHLDIGVRGGGTLYADGSQSSYNASGQSGRGNTTFTSGVSLTSGNSVDVIVIVDHSVVEVYAGGGAAVISKRAYPLGEGREVQLFSRGSGGAGCAFDVAAWSLRGME
jgi:hypothetical protein